MGGEAEGWIVQSQPGPHSENKVLQLPPQIGHLNLFFSLYLGNRQSRTSGSLNFLYSKLKLAFTSKLRPEVKMGKYKETSRDGPYNNHHPGPGSRH